MVNESENKFEADKDNIETRKKIKLDFLTKMKLQRQPFYLCT